MDFFPLPRCMHSPLAFLTLCRYFSQSSLQVSPYKPSRSLEILLAQRGASSITNSCNFLVKSIIYGYGAPCVGKARDLGLAEEAVSSTDQKSPKKQS